ncbi:MAG: HD domain-containing protein [Saprospiraceae bacterium]
MKLPVPEYLAAEKAVKAKLEKELPAGLTYHGVHHTMDVMQAGLAIAETEKLSKKDIQLLRLAIWFHDSGFTSTYRGHEEAGCLIAKKMLPKFHFDNEDIEVICGLIRATKIPQTPDTLLERIICDADLDYLGRSDVYEIADTLFQEIKNKIGPINENDWNDLQISFLEAHNYFTSFAKKHRAPSKLKYLKQLKKQKITA